MTTQTNLYIEKILKEHPAAVWSLDEDFSNTGPFAYLDSFYTVVSAEIPAQTTSNGGGFMSFNTSTPHGLQPGDHVQISGVTPSGYNGRYTVYGISSTTNFTVNGSTTGNITVPTVPGTATKVYNAHEINAYNTDRYPGYVLFNTPGSGMTTVNTRALVSTVPLAYGSSDAKYGSFILPSFGMFSDAGRYKQFTLETWVKIKRSNNTNKYKLIGIFNEDPTYDDGNGLYYNDTSLVLKIGDKSDSVFIKQVNKPMLIHITYSENAANLFINGEQVINLTLEESDILQLATPTNNKYYLSFQSATFDCPAMYPYRLSTDQAKAHYAYGQAVLVPETINKRYGSKTISVDFSSAKYTNMMNYPTNAEWKHGVSDNVDIAKYSLSNKEYSLPNFNFYDTVAETVQTLDDFFSGYTGSWNFKSCLPNANSNIEFSTLDIFDNKLKGFYTEFSFTGTTTSTTEKTIFKIIDKFTKNYLKITIQYNGSDTEIKYKFKYNSANETTLHTQTAADYYQSSSNKTFLLVGLDIEKFATSFGNDITNFFNNLNNLTMFAFGDNDTTFGDTTPNVDILSIKLLTQITLDKCSSLINSNGTFYHSVNTVTPGTTQYVANTSVASYQLSINSKNIFNTSYTYSSSNASENYFTTGSYGYWKDSVPLLHFAKNVVKNGVSSYTFDFIQFNIDYDAPVYNTSPVSGIKYFDTTNSNAKTYITFEPISETYKPDSYFTTTKLARLDRVIEPDASWATTKYEVVDGMVIYLPPSQDISTLKMVVHVEVAVSDSVNNSVQIKSLEMASQALNDSITNPIGTKYANDVIPYKYNTLTSTYDYDGYNPFIIEKKTSPYLNLERLSGIRLVGFNRVDANTVRGIRVPLNDRQMKYSKLNSVQMFVYYDATIDPAQSNAEAYQFSTNTEIFNIVASDRTLSAYLTGASTTSKTLAISSTAGGLNENIKFYINGELSATPQIKTNTWTLLTIVFSIPLSFDNFIGEFNITGPMAFDNISFYGFKNENYISNQIDRTWSNVLNPDTGSSQYLWNAWSDDYWLDLLTMLNPNQQAISAPTLYKIYTGTNILYPGTYDRDQKLQISDMSFSVYSDYTTYKYTYPAV